MNLATTIALYGGGVGSGCKGPNCGRPKTKAATPPSEPVEGTGWYKEGKFYPITREGKMESDHMATAREVGLATNKESNLMDVLKKHPTLARVVVLSHAGLADVECFSKACFKDVLPVLPKEVREVTLEWYEPKQESAILSKEEAIEMYAARRFGRKYKC